MKYMKMLGLVAVAAAAMMAFAASASATELYSGATTQKAGTVLDFSLKSGTKATLTQTDGTTILDECSISTVKGTITNAGSSTTTTTGELAAGNPTWESCSFPTKTVTTGNKLEIHHIAGTTNGTLTADSEIGVTINTVFFGSCIYGVKAGTTLGTLTGNVPAGGSTFDANAIAIKLSGSAFACPETSRWVATYVGTEPTNLRVEAS